MSKKLKTKSNPEGRNWPDAIVLDVGSNMPMDVYGIGDSELGVRYIRHDLVAEVKAAIAALGEKCGDVTYFEASPTKNSECARRWIRLNDALKSASS